MAEELWTAMLNLIASDRLGGHEPISLDQVALRLVSHVNGPLFGGRLSQDAESET